MDPALGGGKFMGQGCYTVSAARYFLGEPSEVVSATMREDEPGSGADTDTEALLRFGAVHVRLHQSSSVLPSFNVQARFTGGSLSVTNYLFPFVYHSINLYPNGGAARSEQLYGAGETTFELQLKAFAAAVRGSPYQPSPADAARGMEVIDAIYHASGLKARPSTRTQ